MQSYTFAEVFVDRKNFLKRALLIGLISALPAVVNAAPHGGGSSGGHSASGGHPSFGVGGRGGPRPAGYMHNYRYAYAGNTNSWHGNSGSWRGRGDWHRHGGDEEHEHHHHHRFSFGFFPYWYPGWGYYDYGYPYYAYDYQDYYYPDNGYYSGQSGSASVPVLVQDALARRGYYAGQVDGVIGPETRAAIREFQRDNGLAVTGGVNSQLLQALKGG
jgi:hypothetical protein